MITVTPTRTPGLKAHLNQRPDYDPVLIMILSAMARFPEVCMLARRTRPSAFGPGEARALATSLVTGRPVDLTGLSRREVQRLPILVSSVARERLPDEAWWGEQVLLRFVEDNFDEVLIEVLLWAAEQIRQRQRVSFIRSRVLHAFDIAECNVPFDPIEQWEGLNVRP